MIERITITDRDRWLALRKRDVTASVVGALFGVHPYETLAGLYAEKSGVEFPDIDNAVLRRGRLLEPVVAAAVAEQRPEWRIVKATEYLRDPHLRLGATPDFYIEGDPRGLGVLQTKTVAPKEFKRSWADDTVPFWIALQNATELMLEREAAFGCVAALIVDPYKLDCPIFEIPRHAGVEARIEEAVRQFWIAIEFGEEPAIDYARDGALIDAMHAHSYPGKVADLTGDNHLPVLLAERAELKAKIAIADARCEEIENEVRAKMGDAETARIDGFAISFKEQERKQRFQPASRSRVLRITDVRDKREANNEGPY